MSDTINIPKEDLLTLVKGLRVAQKYMSDSRVRELITPEPIRKLTAREKGIAKYKKLINK